MTKTYPPDEISLLTWQIHDMASTGEMAHDVNIFNKKLSMTGTVKTEIQGMKMELETETYAVDDYIYTKSMNMWI